MTCIKWFLAVVASLIGNSAAADCKDNSQYCSYWAKAGECESNPEYMKVQCKFSCALCPPSPPPPPTPTPPPAPATCSSHPGMNNGGDNLESSARSASNAHDCCSACLKESGCVGYTFVQVKGECWLKSRIDELTPDSYAESGSVDAPVGPTPAPPPTPPPTPLPPGSRRPVAPVTPPASAHGTGWGNAGPSGGHALLGGQKSAKVLGKTLRFTVDIGQVGCGCTAGVYFVEWGDGGQCDASGTFPQRCGEIDLLEGNKFSWHSTLHNAQDHPGLAGGFGGVQQPDMMYGKGPRDMTGGQYGPGGSIIDTNRPFHAAVSFPKAEDGSLADMVIMLYQDGRDQVIEWRVNKPRADAQRSPALTCEDGGCPSCFSKPGCVYKQPDMKRFGEWLENGMTPLSTWWSGDNTWLDGVVDGEVGGCKLGRKGQPGTEDLGDYAGGGGCGGGYSVNGFTLEDIQNPGSGSWEAVFEMMDAHPVFDRSSAHVVV